ncbi:MAG: hypothetical protein FWF25_00520 [Propionibacteriaceae bacterium]|nr:hypothetical protein [Propionibacteriaceae bacterium]
MTMRMRDTTHKKRNALIAAGTGVALLLGGSTYALWSQIADLGGTQIRSGDLGLATQAKEIWDISADLSNRPDTLPFQVYNQAGDPLSDGKLILKEADLDQPAKVPGWTTVPGDELAVVIPFTIAMQGENLLARLDVNTSDTSNINPALVGSLAMYMNVTYGLYDAENNLVTTITPPAGSKSFSVYYATTANPIITEETKNATVIQTRSDSMLNDFTLCVLMMFDEKTSFTIGTQTMVQLSNAINLGLTQVRD